MSVPNRRRKLELSPTACSRLWTPEQLVGFGFRAWIAGYQTGDIGCWERAWRIYLDTLGARDAQLAVEGLSNWARAVLAAANRRVEVGADLECGFCRDECLAISMVAACQHDTCPAMRACAFTLMESSLMDEVLYHTQGYAVTMCALQQVVSPRWIMNASALIEPQGAMAH